MSHVHRDGELTGRVIARTASAVAPRIAPAEAQGPGAVVRQRRYDPGMRFQNSFSARFG
jgi:hypothetical protein